MKNPPRTTKIRGQKHLLAYITPDEAALLKARGGSGELHNGIPSYPPSARGGSGLEGSGGGGYEGGGGRDRGRSEDRDAAVAGRERMEDFDAMVADDVAAQAGALSVSADQSNQEQAARMAALFPEARQYVQNVSSLQNLNRQLEDLSRREQLQKDRINSFWSLIPGVGAANYLGLQNVRNLASAAIGQPPGLFAGLGFGNRISPDFRGLGVSDLVGLQSQAVTDDMGNIIGFRDANGTLKYGTDPNQPMFDDGRGPDTVPATTNPVTGEQQCPDGYMFDDDLQACRLAGGLPGGDTTTGVGATPYTGNLYGRMGLLDIAPTGLGMFKQRFGAGFGSPSEFGAANTAFRQSGGVMQQYPGYTLLS